MKTWVQTIFFVFSFRINIHTLSDWEHLTDETNYIVLSEVNQIPHLWQVWNKTNTSEVALKKKKWNDNASLEKQANPTVKDTRTKSVSISTGKSSDTPWASLCWECPVAMQRRLTTSNNQKASWSPLVKSTAMFCNSSKNTAWKILVTQKGK